MDGIDAALVRLSGPPEQLQVRTLAGLTMPYPKRLRLRLLRMAAGETTCSGEISELNFLVGELFARAALQVCRRARVAPRRLAVIGSHGQTVFHQGRFALRHAGSGRGLRTPSTLQIGEPAIIAQRTGTCVVASFRAADMAAGGEGAPLVPLVDYLLLRHESTSTVALNLGGIANLTVIPAGADPDAVFGFDAGPGNMVIDTLMRRQTRGRQNYDAGGRLAAQGQVIGPLFTELTRFPFFRRPPPKSAGREQFGESFVKRYFTGQRARLADLLRTATQLTAWAVAEALRRFVFPRLRVDRLVVSGGGVHNRLLLSTLRDYLPHVAIDLSDRYGLPADFKEAIAFAILADRTLRGLPGNLPTVTGARRPVILGQIAPGRAPQ
jgi:anhydro-N-acetylmuramic acid kinase